MSIRTALNKLAEYFKEPTTGNQNRYPDTLNHAKSGLRTNGTNVCSGQYITIRKREDGTRDQRIIFPITTELREDLYTTASEADDETYKAKLKKLEAKIGRLNGLINSVAPLFKLKQLIANLDKTPETPETPEHQIKRLTELSEGLETLLKEQITDLVLQPHFDHIASSENGLNMMLRHQIDFYQRQIEYMERVQRLSETERKTAALSAETQEAVAVASDTSHSE